MGTLATMPHRYRDPNAELDRISNNVLVGEITEFEFTWDPDEEAYFWVLEGGQSAARSRLVSEPGAEVLEVEFTTDGYVRLPDHFHKSREMVVMLEGQCTVETFEELEYGVHRESKMLSAKGDTTEIPAMVWHGFIFWTASRCRIVWEPPHPACFKGGPRDGERHQ